MRILKAILVLVLLFAMLFAAGGVFAHTRTEQIISWSVFLLLVVIIYSPPFWRWFRGKG